MACLALAAFASAARADESAPMPMPIPTTVAMADPPRMVLAQQRSALDAIEKQLRDSQPDALELPRLRAAAAAAEQRSNGVVAELTPALNLIDARLAELGPAPAASAAPESADVSAQRLAIGKQLELLTSQIQLARLLSVEAGQLGDQVAGMRRARFNDRIGERSASVFGGDFWRELRTGAPKDLARAQALWRSLVSAVAAAPAWLWMAALGGCIASAMAWAFGVRWLLGLSARRIVQGRLRRSLLALTLTLLGTAACSLAAQLLRWPLAWHLPADSPLAAMLAHGAGMIGFGAFMACLGWALLSPDRPSWRLAPLSDRAVEQLRHFPLLLAVAIATGSAAEHAVGVLNLGLSTALAVSLLFALAQAWVLAWALKRIRRLMVSAEPVNDAANANPAIGGAASDSEKSKTAASISAALKPAPGAALATLPWATAIVWLVAAVLVFAVVCLAIGYVALGSFLVKQIAWAVTLTAAVYLLNALIDDALTSGFGSVDETGNESVDATASTGNRIRAQAGVLLSAAARLAVLLFAVLLLLAPFGQGPGEIFNRADRLRSGIAIGAVHLQPATMLQGLLVFAFAAIAVRLVQRWLRERFLPTTRLDAAMRESATSLLGFVGVIAALALALSAVGLGLERIAWVASALSVGIGFGLQAVVSNFVSGLILLAERPVKVGDWVSLSGVEGDIRRINVRATEIQMGDRSTVIVPNSEFITKIVRNVTLSNPMGLVSLKFPMPLDTDVERVRDIVLEAFEAHEGVLKTPGPNVFLDGIEHNHLNFNASASVSSPRQSYGVRSALLFDILARFKKEGLTLAQPTKIMVQETGTVHNGIGSDTGTASATQSSGGSA